jgi:uncharacterized membrane protein YeiH
MSVLHVADRVRPYAIASQVRYPKPRFGLLRVFDLAAIAVLSLEGGTIAADAGVGALGIVIAAFITGLGGGIIRDLLLGDTPPATLRTVSYPLVTLAAGCLVCLIPGGIHALPSQVVNILDAAALSLICVSGALKALDRRASVITAVILGGVSALGGGMIRDALLTHVPAALRSDMCVIAVLVGAAVAVACTRSGRSRFQAMAIGITSCFVVRVVAGWEHWHLPLPHIG